MERSCVTSPVLPRINVLRLVALLWLCLLGTQAPAEEIKSPNANLTLTFALQPGGVPTYRVTYKGRDVILTSKLGLELKNAPALTSGFSVTDSKTTTFDETWQPVTDTWHETLEDAKHQAEFEYEGVASTWLCPASSEDAAAD